MPFEWLHLSSLVWKSYTHFNNYNDGINVNVNVNVNDDDDDDNDDDNNDL